MIHVYDTLAFGLEFIGSGVYGQERSSRKSNLDQDWRLKKGFLANYGDVQNEWYMASLAICSFVDLLCYTGQKTVNKMLLFDIRLGAPNSSGCDFSYL